jgi:hypothetical protein
MHQRWFIASDTYGERVYLRITLRGPMGKPLIGLVKDSKDATSFSEKGAATRRASWAECIISRRFDAVQLIPAMLPAMQPCPVDPEIIALFPSIGRIETQVVNAQT